jgi:hypothetical protein
MLVPVGAALGALARTIEFRAIAAAIEFGTIIAWTIKLGTIEFGPLAERTITRRAIVARTRKARTVVAAPLLGARPPRGAASRFCQGFESLRSLRLRSGAPRENFRSPSNLRSGRSPRGA